MANCRGKNGSSGEGNGNPLQCSCLENPRDRRAWSASIYGVAQSWAWLTWLSSSSSSSGRFYFLGLQNHCGWWQQPWKYKMLALWKESYDKPRHHIKKQRLHFANKGSCSQSYVFPVVMYGFKIWTIQKTEHWRIYGFEMQCWGRFLRVSWIARWSNCSILKEINPEYHWKDWFWSWSSNTLAFWCEVLVHWKRLWCL